MNLLKAAISRSWSSAPDPAGDLCAKDIDCFKYVGKDAAGRHCYISARTATTSTSCRHGFVTQRLARWGAKPRPTPRDATRLCSAMDSWKAEEICVVTPIAGRHQDAHGCSYM